MRRVHWFSALVLAGLATGTAFSTGSRGGGKWTLIGWNDLGMHCMDSDFSVFSILPPFNNVHAQLIDAAGNRVTDATGISVTYQAVADPTGSINRSSKGKTNFWTYSAVLYGASSTPDEGLTGNHMPGAANDPQPMAFDSASAMFAASGVPITPYDDGLHKRPYPLMKLVARDAFGTELASTTPVLPVSDEMDCRLCHGSDSGPAAMPGGGWSYERNSDRDYRLNVLKLHDEKQAGDPEYAAALAAAGYSDQGLFDTVTRLGVPILCARCHASNALPGTGQSGISPLTEAVHAGHSQVIDPLNGLSLDSSTNRAACYRCHPGSVTRCLRGAMGGAVAPDGSLAMQCQSCHGNMSRVGTEGRVGWLEQPNCQNCHTGTATHNNGKIRYLTTFETDGTLRQAVDDTFATNPDVPLPGFSLYRFSEGHGGLQCEACHGSTHAEFPAIHPNDNLQSLQLQGHEGMLVDCLTCHASTPDTVVGGPHGMHPIGQQWVEQHHDLVSDPAQCKACHGSNYRGTVLSHAQADRTFDLEHGVRTFFRGARISCYACHNGPDEGDPSGNRDPIVQDASTFCVDQPVDVSLQSSDPDGDSLTLHIVQQPRFGRVGLSGSTATYYPDPGFAGVDSCTFAAWDGAVESNLGVISITRGATWSNYGIGYPGSGGIIPTLTSDAPPALGSTIHVHVDNTSLKSTLVLFVLSMEVARIPTQRGGTLATEPVQFLIAPLPAGGAVIPWQVPGDPALVGVSAFVQALQPDPGARYQVAFSDGMRLTLGQ